MIARLYRAHRAFQILRATAIWKAIRDADREPPAATFDNAEDMLKWLDETDPRSP